MADKVILKAGTQSLCESFGRLYVTNGCLTDWICLYNHCPQWVCDGLFKFNKPIFNKLNSIAIENFNACTLAKAYASLSPTAKPYEDR